MIENQKVNPNEIMDTMGDLINRAEFLFLADKALLQLADENYIISDGCRAGMESMKDDLIVNFDNTHKNICEFLENNKCKNIDNN